MKRQVFPKSVSDISEADFWASLRPVNKQSDSALLGEAIKLGKAGQKAKAYARLAAYHRRALAEEWQLIRRQELNAPRPKPAILTDMLNHKFTAWHKQVVKFGPKIEWVPESLRQSLGGFHYMGWFRPAVTAFIQTGRKRYRDFIVDIMTQYYDARKHPEWDKTIKPLVFYPLGANAKWRTMLASYLALINSGRTATHTLEGLMKTFLGFGRGLNLCLKEFVPANNAFAVGTTTLLWVARVFPEFSASPRWDRKAVGFVVQQAREGFYPDGGNRERVWGYGLMTLGSLTTAYDLAKRYGGLGDSDGLVLKAIRRGYRWYGKSAGPDPQGLFPTYGDAGVGNGLHMLKGAERFFPADKAGSYGVDRSKSYLLRSSGFAIMRNGNRRDSSYVNINFGEFGGWHSHFDLLSMNFWSQGKCLLDELCRFGPYSNPLDTLFREPQSHNLLLIDGMVYDSRNVKGRNVAWFSNDAIDYFSATHRAYHFYVFGKGPSPVSPNIEALVRRTVLFVKDPGYAVVLDSVTDLSRPTFNRSISQYWHSPFAFEAIGANMVRTRGKQACLLAYARSEGLHRLDVGVDFVEGEVTHLGQAHDRYSLRARRWMPLTHEGVVGFATLLYPFTGKLPPVSIRALKTSGGAAWRSEALEITTPSGKDIIVLNPENRKGFTYAGKAVSARACVKLGRGRGQAVVK